MATRFNHRWRAFDDALADLQLILLAGLHRGLLNQINTNAPEFATQAEDFVQEALLKILDNLNSFAGRSQFTTWAHKIAISVALTELRRKRWQDASLDGLTAVSDGDYTPNSWPTRLRCLKAPRNAPKSWPTSTA